MQTIETKMAPAAIGTYSQAVRVDNTVYISGQIPLDVETMQICGDEIRSQIIKVIENLSEVCKAAGGNLSNIVKLNVYLTDLNHFPLVNEVMRQFFAEPFPARAAIGVASLPRDSQVEMDAVMVLSS